MNLQSTKSSPITPSEDLHPPKIPSKTNLLLATLITAPHKTTKGITYTDQTGKFPYTSTRGNKYIFTLYDYDANCILVKAIPDQNASTLVDAWTSTHARLTKNGHTTTTYIMDNECSADLRSAIQDAELHLELVPPHVHRRNAAERAIQTFKDHFLAGLATCDPTFPVREWDRLLHQAELTINLLRNSRVNPSLSAWAYLFGPHDFNKMPLAPPGTKVIVHDKPGQRGSWDYHGQDGFYIGPAPSHYRCLKTFIPKTRAERISDTVTLLPHKVPIPNPSLKDHIISTSEQLIHLLTNKKKPIGPFLPPSSKKSLLDLAQLLHNDKTSPIPVPPATPSPTSDDATVITSNTTNSKLSSTSEGVPSNIHTTTPTTSEGGLQPSTTTNITSEGDTPLPPTTIQSPSFKITNPTKFKRFLRAYVKSNKSELPMQRNKRTTYSLPSPKTPSFTLPTPKRQSSYPPSFSLHPMKLRRRQHSPTLGTHFKRLAAQHLIHVGLQPSYTSYLSLSHIYASDGTRLNVDKLLHQNPIIWRRSVSNEIGRLAQGIQDIKGNNAMQFIKKSDVPKHKKVTYANMVCDIRERKDDKF